MTTDPVDPKPDDDERVSLEGLDPKEALKALLAVKPDAEPVEPAEAEDDSADESTP